MEPDEPILDPLVALAHVGAHTERIKLGTGVIILPSETRWSSPSRSRASTC